MKTLLISLVVVLVACGVVKGPSSPREAAGIAAPPPALLCACGAASDEVA
jgi:hypothetical protein